MTPQEKAQQLVAKMTGFTVIDCKYNALIAVDEIIQTYHSPMDDEQIQEWQEIKQEIQKL
jgi:hypothetical protein